MAVRPAEDPLPGGPRCCASDALLRHGGVPVGDMFGIFRDPL
jgi:hypothetical protein